MAETLHPSLQESVLVVLAFNERYGTEITFQVEPSHFDGIYRNIAEGILSYRARYRKPPGASHLADLFPEIRKNASLKTALMAISSQADSINAPYVASRAQDFVRRQVLKTAIIEAGQLYEGGGLEEGLVGSVEGILSKALRLKKETLEAGTFLSNYNRLYEFHHQQSDYCSIGIPELDQLKIGPTPGEMLLYIGPKGTGKSWFCIHCGIKGLTQKLKVCHISLENSEEVTLSRYHQAIFGVAKRKVPQIRTILEKDEHHLLKKFRYERFTPKYAFNDPDVWKYLKPKIKTWGTRLDRLVIKRFPTGSLSVDQIEAYLDFLELSEGFIPNMLIVDYPDLMQIDQRDFRHSLGKIFIDLRGLQVRRNLMGVFPTQGTRETIGARKVRSKDVAEDITKVNTADMTLTYSQTAEEYRLGIARLAVGHARNEVSGTEVVLAQNYAMGQYLLNSALLSGMYWDRLDELTGDAADHNNDT